MDDSTCSKFQRLFLGGFMWGSSPLIAVCFSRTGLAASWLRRHEQSKISFWQAMDRTTSLWAGCAGVDNTQFRDTAQW